MSQSIIPRAAVRGAAFGVLFMAFFGTLWAANGIRGLQGWGFLWLVIVSLFMSVMLLIGGILLLRNSKDLSNNMSEDHIRSSTRQKIWFGIIFGLEGALIAADAMICQFTNHTNLFVLLMALIVGAHFFPLAYLFRVRIHYVAGTQFWSLCAIS